MRKTKKVIEISVNPYKWHKNWGKLQQNFSNENFKYKRINTIETLIKSKNFEKVFHYADNYLDLDLPLTTNLRSCDIILVTAQKYSRLSCSNIIRQIKVWLGVCPKLYLCLNRHYLNIDNQKLNLKLPYDYQEAISVWLKSQLIHCNLQNLSERYSENGSYFTWVIPDQHFYIEKI
tara:strand:- start:1021 stop:1548 length:528 start_codon:yes stop_codon:yes gene_type:complete